VRWTAILPLQNVASIDQSDRKRRARKNNSACTIECISDGEACVSQNFVIDTTLLT
jgi:hypothetical protein